MPICIRGANVLYQSLNFGFDVAWVRWSRVVQNEEIICGYSCQTVDYFTVCQLVPYLDRLLAPNANQNGLGPVCPREATLSVSLAIDMS